MSQNTTPLSVLPEAVPAELRALPQWVCWAIEPRRKGETPTKIPYTPDGRRRAKANDPATWGAFAAALETYHSPRRPPWAGVGFEFAANGGIVGIDLDSCRDPGNGNFAPWAIEIVERFTTYTEVSPSGTGVKLWCRGRLPGTGSGKRKSYQGGAVELYGRGRFFAVTGHKLDSAPPSVNEAQEAIEWLFSLFLSPTGKSGSLDSRAVGRSKAQSGAVGAVRHSKAQQSQCAPPYQPIESAILATLPGRVGERRRCLFEFARRLKALPALADVELLPHVRRWHAQALPTIGTKPFDDSWFDFLQAWEAVKYPAGAGPIEAALARADAAELPEVALDYESRELRRLIALCRELQRVAGDAPFFLACRAPAELLNVSPTKVSAWLRGLCRAGVLRLESRSQARGQASEYRYLPPL